LEIRFCKIEETEKLQRFIHEKWKQGHILSLNRELLLWQHHEAGSEHLNFVVAALPYTGEFVAILGFIPLWRFDGQLTAYRQLWLSLWKVDERPDMMPGTGLQLLHFLEEQLSPDWIGVSGINEQVVPLYEWLEYQTGVFNHFYICNPEQTPVIAAGLHRPVFIPHPSALSGKHVDDPDDSGICFTDIPPHKSATYFRNRYQKHPWYHYRFFQIGPALFVYRKIVVGSAACLRIIDIAGDVSALPDCTADFVGLLRDEQAEYIDCLQAGWDPGVFHRMGFRLRTDDELIPEYFEPLVRKNVSIRYAVKSASPINLFFKGDGDQDRPNLLIS
jgi:hypothetical protein